MTRPIPDKAEVALEYPDKLYVGTFERTSRFEAHLGDAGVALTLQRPGDEATRKSVHLHLHYGLLAGILRELAASVDKIPPHELHREELTEAVGALSAALNPGG